MAVRWMGWYRLPNLKPGWTISDGAVSTAEFDAWLAYLVSVGEAVKYDGAWIFDIADLVISGQTVSNDGTKLFQIRFYPVAITEFGQ